jgi:hypothetical protein
MKMTPNQCKAVKPKELTTTLTTIPVTPVLSDLDKAANAANSKNSKNLETLDSTPVSDYQVPQNIRKPLRIPFSTAPPISTPLQKATMSNPVNAQGNVQTHLVNKPNVSINPGAPHNGFISCCHSQ